MCEYVGRNEIFSFVCKHKRCIFCIYKRKKYWKTSNTKEEIFGKELKIIRRKDGDVNMNLIKITRSIYLKASRDIKALYDVKQLDNIKDDLLELSFKSFYYESNTLFSLFSLLLCSLQKREPNSKNSNYMKITIKNIKKYQNEWVWLRVFHEYSKLPGNLPLDVKSHIINYIIVDYKTAVQI